MRRYPSALAITLNNHCLVYCNSAIKVVYSRQNKAQPQAQVPVRSRQTDIDRFFFFFKTRTSCITLRVAHGHGPRDDADRRMLRQ